MDRKSFFKTCGLMCIGGGFLPALLQGCAGTKIMSGNIDGDRMIVLKKDFELTGKNGFRSYVVLQNDLLKYPICVFRLSDAEYSAVWMRCTHQGAELQVFGNTLQCPAHGSEFTKFGKPSNGPAEEGLRVFPVVAENDRLSISLKVI